MGLSASAIGNAEKAAVSAVEGTAAKAAAKSTGRSYMGQLHSSVTDIGENLGMSRKAAGIVGGIGMAGAGIGAFSVANNASENHPFLGGAAKIGILGAAGYAAFAGRGGAKAIEEAVEGAGAKKAGARAGKAATGTKPVEQAPGDFLGNPRKFSSVGGAGNNAAGAVSTGGGVASAAAAVEKTAVPNAAGTVAATAPAMNVAEASKEATSGTVSTNAGLHSAQSSSSVDAGTTSVSGRIGQSQGAGSTKVSDQAESKKASKQASHDTARRNKREAEKQAARNVATGTNL